MSKLFQAQGNIDLEMMHRCYLSGPVTGHPDYMEEFLGAEKILLEKGLFVVNPVKVNTLLPADTSYEEFMHVCFAMMDICDTIVLLHGWETSSGANRELLYAERRNMNVLHMKDITI